MCFGIFFILLRNYLIQGIEKINFILLRNDISYEGKITLFHFWILRKLFYFIRKLFHSHIRMKIKFFNHAYISQGNSFNLLGNFWAEMQQTSHCDTLKVKIWVQSRTGHMSFWLCISCQFFTGFNSRTGHVDSFLVEHDLLVSNYFILIESSFQTLWPFYLSMKCSKTTYFLCLLNQVLDHN